MQRTSIASWSAAIIASIACEGAPATIDAGADARVPDASVREPDAGSREDAQAPVSDPWARGPSLGARRHGDGSIEVRVRSENATRVEVAFFSAALGETDRLRVPLEHDADLDRFEVRVTASELAAAGLGEPLYYGLRVWGPNWTFDPAWAPGSELGFVEEIDDDGNRMNPNKLVFDPYALEITHDPIGPGHTTYSPFRGDEENRATDSAPFAPKGIVIDVPAPLAPGPGRALRDHIVYEVHLRGLTFADASLPENERGTYAGARARARALADLGVTAIELLPLHETPNDQNELTPDSTRGDNYWGYSTLSYFAPDRRYAADRAPGGPTRELMDMIRAFHDEGLEVWVDVVYNHTSEGTAGYLSLRGVDDAMYYEHADDPRRYVNGNGVGPNVNTARPIVADLVVDSLRYWHEILGADGFRFDLAPIVANGCSRGCYRFDPGGLPERIAMELARADDGGPGAILVAEPWGVVAGSYQLGRFPFGWAEWNDRYRDTLRRDLNRLGVETVTLRELGRRFAGSPDIFDARGPQGTVNFLTAHDGFTLRDLFSYDDKDNDQEWPWGPSDGGSDNNIAWRHPSDARQRHAARTAMALLALSHGVPMIVGGDEFLRTQRGNNNPYNLDSPGSWLDPEGPANEAVFHGMTSRLFAFRNAHAALRTARHLSSSRDSDGDGRPELAWYTDQGERAGDGYLDAGDRHFLGWVIDGDELGDRDAAIWIAYNGWSSTVDADPPPAPSGTEWHRAIDTGEAGADFDHARAIGEETRVESWPYPVEQRAVAVFVARAP